MSRRAKAGRYLAALVVFGCAFHAAPKAAAAFKNVHTGT